MAALIDTLYSDISVSGQAEFTAATPGALYKTVAVPGVDGLPFFDANGNQWLDAGDNVLLQKLGWEIPYGFGQGPGLHRIGLAWQNNDGDLYIIRELSGNSIIVIPDNLGLDLEGQSGANGLFLTVPDGNHERKRLVLTNIELNVSQINLPADLDGEVIKVQYYAQILHSKPCQAAPA